MVAQVIKNQIEKIEYREKKIFWMLFSFFMLFLVLYGFLVNNTIMNAVSEQNLDGQMAALNSNVNSLESTYLSMKDEITMAYALSKGFVAVSENNFALVTPTEKTLSLSINEN